MATEPRISFAPTDVLELNCLISSLATAFDRHEKDLALILNPMLATSADIPTNAEMTPRDNSTPPVGNSRQAVPLDPAALPSLPSHSMKSCREQDVALEREKLEGIVKVLAAQNEKMKDTILMSFGMRL